MRVFILIFGMMICAGIAQAQSRPGTADTSHTAPERVEPEPIIPEDKKPVPTAKEEQEKAQSSMMERLEHEQDLVVQNAPQVKEILIFADIGERQDILSILQRRELDILEDYTLHSLGSILLVTKGDNTTLQQLRAQLSNAEVDWNDNLSASKGPRLYAKEKIKWPSENSKSGACLDKALRIPIGLIDGRIDRGHPAFAGQTIVEKNFLDNVTADQSHATAIASILIGNASHEGFDGLLKGTQLYSAIALRRSPKDQQLASIAAILRGLDWLMGKNIRLINVSLAGQKNRVLEKGFKMSLERGTLIFAAAGNNGPHAPPAYPAAIDGIFAVTAIDVSGRTYKHANRGDYIDFSAPGVDVWAATPGGSGGYKSGTSYAVPYALGAAALKLTQNAQLSAAILRKTLDRDITAACP
jgi:hypothetical protein